MNDTVAVIVTYNRKILLKECIEAVRSQTMACDILAIDNAGTDGTKGFIEGLLKVGGRAQHDSFGFLASRIIYDDGALCEINMPRAGMFRKRCYPYRKSYMCDLACYTSVLFPRSVVAELGLPIRGFFIWSDDWEYTRRSSRHNRLKKCDIIHPALYPEGIWV